MNSTSILRTSAQAVDVAGNVYIADTGNKRIRKVTIDGAIATFAGQTASLEPGDGGPALEAFLDYPTYLAVSCTALYVNDSSRIRAIALTAPLIAQNGVVSTASSSTTVRVGEQFAISGCNLASSTATADPAFSIPTTLGGMTASVNGISVPLLSVSPNQITAQLPAGVTAGTATLVVSVTGNGTATASMSVN